MEWATIRVYARDWTGTVYAIIAPAKKVKKNKILECTFRFKMPAWISSCSTSTTPTRSDQTRAGYHSTKESIT